MEWPEERFASDTAPILVGILGENPYGDALLSALKEGWIYLFVFALLIFMMVGLRRETLAPFWATGLLLVVNQFMKAHRFSLAAVFSLQAGQQRGSSFSPALARVLNRFIVSEMPFTRTTRRFIRLSFLLTASPHEFIIILTFFCQ